MLQILLVNFSTKCQVFYHYLDIADNFAIFVQMDLNEADIFKSSSILIYYNTEQSFYTQNEMA